jgi:hypothetical protein
MLLGQSAPYLGVRGIPSLGPYGPTLSSLSVSTGIDIPN